MLFKFFKNLLGAVLLIYVLLFILNKFGIGIGLDIKIISDLICILLLGICGLALILFILKPFYYFKETKNLVLSFITSAADKIKDFFVTKWVKWGLIPCLFILGTVMSLISMFKADDVLTLLVHDHKNLPGIFNDKELLAGETGSFYFIANEDNLGIVSVRFKTFARINDDILTFRIKSLPESEWYYENLYKTDQFQDEQFFTFGFPPIPDSQNKSFLVEIESIYGYEDNAVAFSEIEPKVQTKYKFQKEELQKNKLLLGRFLFKKSARALFDYNFYLAGFVYFLPLLFYISAICFGGKLMGQLKTINDYFSASLIIYLLIQIYIQIARLLNEYANLKLKTDSYLSPANNFLLGIVFILGAIVALRGEDKSLV